MLERIMLKLRMAAITERDVNKAERLWKTSQLLIMNNPFSAAVYYATSK